ncbi:MAG: hypothetical protein JSW50_00385, partial [Candidatus Latescibacterota bacterium]
YELSRRRGYTTVAPRSKPPVMFWMKNRARSIILAIMKRVSILIIAVLVVIAAAATIIQQFGSLERESPEVDRALELLTILGSAPGDEMGTSGRWSVPENGKPLTQLTEAERRKLESLGALPYVQGSTKAPSDINVTIFDADRAYEGINLYNSGHGPEALAVDMDGNVLHRWRYPIDDIWPDVPETPHGTFWRRVYWYPSGDILAIFEGIGLIKLDRESNLLWSYRRACHHAVTVDADGRIFVLTREITRVPEIADGQPILEDWFDILSPEGKLISRHSVMEAIVNSDVLDLHTVARTGGDILHTNSLHPFDGSLERMSPAYKRGNVLVSILNFDLVGIIDPSVAKMI